MPSQILEVPFDEWKPDVPDRSAGANEAKGVISAEGAYRPIPDVSAITTATANARIQGAGPFYNAQAVAKVFVGTSTKLYELVTVSLTDRSGTTYACPNDSVWQFAQYGQLIIAINPYDSVQYYDMDSPGNFANLPGTPPKAKVGSRVGDFFVLGDIQSSPIKPSRVQWSAIGDINTWATTATNEADSQDLTEDGGRVMGIFNVYETGIIFQERAITRMTYVGPPTIFEMAVVERAQGSIVAAHGMCMHGSQIFYIAEDGFYVWDGNRSVPISDANVWRYFAADLNNAYRHNIYAAFDFENRAVWWAYPSGSSQVPDSLLIFSLKDNRWTHDSGFDLELIFSFPKQGVTLDSLDSISGSIDALTFSLDSDIYKSSVVKMGGANTSHQLLDFTGSNREAILETAEFQPGPGQRAFVSEIWPLVDDSSATVTAQVAMRDQRLGDSLVYSTARTRGHAGYCPARASGRWGRVRMTIPAASSWTHAQGVQVTFRPAGKR